jgi:hypothetical protein
MEPTREELMAQLEDAKRDLNRFTGGVDPAACVAAAQRITTLRLRLRDDAALISHFMQVAAQPPRLRRRRRN